jgi:hypothetical protein
VPKADIAAWLAVARHAINNAAQKNVVNPNILLRLFKKQLGALRGHQSGEWTTGTRR